MTRFALAAAALLALFSPQAAAQYPSKPIQAPADGYMLFVNASSFLINAQLMSKLPYDPQKDFVPVTLAASNPPMAPRPRNSQRS